MKKFCFLFSFIAVCISCSSDSSGVAENPNLLQRVDFFPGLLIEQHWLFNADGVLTQITKADGTIVQDFTYDSNGRLTSAFIVDYNGNTETHTFTYDNNDFVNSVDGETVNYDTALDAYYTGNLTTVYRLTKINSEKLLLEGRTVVMDIDETGTNETRWYEMYVSYSNGNLLGYGSGDTCNSLTYDDKVNPLRNATLAICKAFSFIPNSPWVYGQYNSANNPLSLHYCLEDPESEIYHYTYNTNNLPQTQTRDNYYLGVYEDTIPTANYYYQGDVLP